MSHLMDLSDEGKIKIARDAVRCNVPISPVISSWLQANGLYDRVTNPRRTHESNGTSPGGPGTAG